jgi:two-component system response regulator FixJ
MAPTSNTTLQNINEPIQVALIDDDAAVLDSLGLYFARHKVGTTCFAAVEAFLATLEETARFDCIVSDVRMPGISGLDLAVEDVGKDSGIAAVLHAGQIMRREAECHIGPVGSRVRDRHVS